ncbi:MAG: hypothetical protein H6742_04460 [Alphaproteobacteria bacterium]|nr:hypothetical protein [Alphaproteobacteria bacterium]
MDALLAQLRADLSEAAARLGAPPRLDELESTADDGRPVLARGLPDNPLAPTVAGVAERCPAVARTDDHMDWVYCPESGEVAAVGLDAPAIGKE